MVTRGRGASFAMEHIDPMKGLMITDRSQIHLGCPEILMAQDDFGDNLQGHPIAAGIGGGMPSQVMRAERDPQPDTSFFDQASDSRIA